MGTGAIVATGVVVGAAVTYGAVMIGSAAVLPFKFLAIALSGTDIPLLPSTLAFIGYSSAGAAVGSIPRVMRLTKENPNKVLGRQFDNLIKYGHQVSLQRHVKSDRSLIEDVLEAATGR